MILNFELDELLAQDDISPTKTDNGKGIIHLCGTRFSGKSTILSQVKNRQIIYDVSSFYRRHGCISNGKMDWKRFREVIHLLPADVDEFISKSGDSNLIIIESSGIGKSIKNIIDYLILEKGYMLHEIYLAPPKNISELTRRMSSRLDNAGSINDEVEYIHVWNRETEKLGKHDKLVDTRKATEILNNLFRRYEINELVQHSKELDDYGEHF